MEWLVVADDLTGACDTGAAFVRAGRRVKVILDPSCGISGVDVLVIDTESRVPSADQSAAAVSEWLRSISLTLDTRAYKKIDSTLRGHPWRELEVVMQIFGMEQALVAPAFPQQGRAVLQGRLYLNGIPVNENSFNPSSAGFGGLLGGGLRTRLLAIDDVRCGPAWIDQWMKEAEAKVILADAETPADLDILARWFLSSRLHLACGSAGLARALAAGCGGNAGVLAREISGRNGPALVIAGSAHPATVRQVTVAAESGVRVVFPAWDDLRIADKREELVSAIQQALNQDQPLILGIAALHSSSPGEELRLAGDLAQVAAAALRGTSTGGLVLTGGDIAAAVFRALGCRAIELGGELAPGIPWGLLEGGLAAGARVVTKAGGFGAENALICAIDFLMGNLPCTAHGSSAV